ncbi:General transcription factor IIH subunit 4 [Nosema granulosis]|uniref:RNA polymerase II transcription factor B subunit 2 n=1 Tax=Nosema granulosis TaxID=83296 RepID=A0A9P6L060_9MICR|nr:General transcription factor IIH subunit 4 [Nosema granulosis]
MSNPQSLMDYIKNLREEDKMALYKSPLFCTSVLKLFDKATISLLFDLLISAPTLKSLQSNKTVKDSLKLLLRLSLITKKGNNLFLDDTFRKSVFSGVCEVKSDCYFTESEIKNTSENFYENTKFQDILQYIVNKNTNNKHFGVLDILIYGKLINLSGDITNTGFEFLLKSRKEQIWSLIVLGLVNFSKNIEEQLETLISLLELSVKKPNVVYKLARSVNIKFYTFLQSLGLLSATGNTIVFNEHFRDLFMITSSKTSSFINIETNFKMYAYTKSEYEISIIKLFSEIQLELPNLIKAMITEESVNRAFEKGVTSSQIIHFLNASLYFGDLPITISNQIKIWESKRNRVQINNGFLYSNFLNLIDFQKVLKFSTDKNCIVDKDIEKRVLVIKPEFNDIVKEYMKSLM